jgi:hypothetical protein
MQSLCSIGHSPQQDNPAYSETVLTVSSRLKRGIPVNSEQEDDNAKNWTSIEEASGTSYTGRNRLYFLIIY